MTLSPVPSSNVLKEYGVASGAHGGPGPRDPDYSDPDYSDPDQDLLGSLRCRGGLEFGTDQKRIRSPVRSVTRGVALCVVRKSRRVVVPGINTS